MTVEEKMNKLFSLHGELGYFNLFDGQMQLVLMILGPRGFGKSELFSLFIDQFNDDYIKFIPVASDGILFQQLYRKKTLSFFSKGAHVSIRGKDGLDWDRKTPIETTFDKNFKVHLKEIKYGILIVGALGTDTKSKVEYRALVKERGQKISLNNSVNLIRIRDSDQYLFELIQQMIENPTSWKQLVIHKEGKLSKIEEEFRLINKIKEYLPQRILELTLPESQNKWGQLNEVFKALVKKMDALLISTVEYKLSRMIKIKTTDLVTQIQHEWRFPEDKQLPDLSGIPEILTIKLWIENKIKQHGKDLDLPQKVIEGIELGILTIQTAFVEDLGSVLKIGNDLSADDLQKRLTIHTIVIEDLLSSLVKKKIIHPETMKVIEDTKEEIDSLDKFLKDIVQGKI
ncbi:MAG: hypothetical protein ACFFDT_24235 [Candidatus Hodarchaeota archaeon]